MGGYHFARRGFAVDRKSRLQRDRSDGVMFQLPVDWHAVASCINCLPIHAQNQPRRTPLALNTRPWWPTVVPVDDEDRPTPRSPPASCSTWTTRSSTPSARRGSPGRRPPLVVAREHALDRQQLLCRHFWPPTAGYWQEPEREDWGAPQPGRGRGSVSSVARCSSSPGATTASRAGSGRSWCRPGSGWLQPFAGCPGDARRAAPQGRGARARHQRRGARASVPRSSRCGWRSASTWCWWRESSASASRSRRCFEHAPGGNRRAAGRRLDGRRRPGQGHRRRQRRGICTRCVGRQPCRGAAAEPGRPSRPHRAGDCGTAAPGSAMRPFDVAVIGAGPGGSREGVGESAVHAAPGAGACCWPATVRRSPARC